jgi:hypothetical protein
MLLDKNRLVLFIRAIQMIAIGAITVIAPQNHALLGAFKLPRHRY